MRSLGQRLSEVQIRERLALVDRWRESGLSMTAWAQGQGLDAGALMGAVAYEGRWRAKLSGQAVNSETKASKAQGFARAKKVANEVIAGKPEISSETVRLEVAGVVMHWPLSRGAELAQWLQSLKAAGA